MRPEFRQLLADLANGVIDGVLFYDLDRLAHQPRNLEDLIDIVKYVKRPATGRHRRPHEPHQRQRPPQGPHDVRDGAQALQGHRPPRRPPTPHRRTERIHPRRIAYGWIRKGEHKRQLVPDEADGCCEPACSCCWW
ncbi:hypothetical protein DY245_30810 [Streptomyces inhibens]|uniref:Resolvase/invertase-type recombinase catalytic domain-containing protein n=1 Tax=Streptomyces inhibens TaxID=2293571 RepID=A0A371PW77_STRIH|nr:hypothetical protein DY245_30810 [Streptomyces inhibens]